MSEIQSKFHQKTRKTGESFHGFLDSLLNPNFEATVFKSKGKLSGLQGLILVGQILEHAVHLQEQFAHHGRQGHLGGLARRPQPRVKFPQGRVLHPRQHHRWHIERAPHQGAAAADVPLAFPRPTLAHPRGEARQSRRRLPVQGAEFGHSAEHTQSGQRAYAIELDQGLDLGLELRGALQGGGLFPRHGLELLLQMGHELLLFPGHEGGHAVFEGLAGTGQLLLQVVAPLHQFAQGFHGRGRWAAWRRAGARCHSR